MTRAYAHLITLGYVLRNHFEGRKDRGATAVEYGLLVGLIAVVIIVAITALGTKLDGLFDAVTSKLPSGA